MSLKSTALSGGFSTTGASGEVFLFVCFLFIIIIIFFNFKIFNSYMRSQT